MRRFFINLSILLIVLLLIIFACKKVNILAPTYIPSETRFKIPSPIPSKVDVNPKPARDGEVFGGFIKKFYYKGEWYVLADYIYKYDPTNQTLTSQGNNALLKLDKDGNLLIIGKNLNNVRDANGISTWTHLKEFDIIETNQVWYQDRNITKYGITNIYYDGKYYRYYQAAIFSNNQSFHSSDLLNWNTQGSDKNIAMGFPLNYQWQNVGYRTPYNNVYFKGKLYVLGGAKGWNLPSNYENINRYDRNFKNIKVIDWGKNGYDNGSWNFFNTPESKSYINVYLYKPPQGQEKLYIKVLGGYYWNFSYKDGDTYVFTTSTEPQYPQNIYSTTGVYETTYKEITNTIATNYIYGRPIITNTTITNIKTNYHLDWQKENELPYSYLYYIDKFYGSVQLNASEHMGPKISFLPTTPKPPDWVYDTNANLYYKANSEHSSVHIGNKTYYLPTPPANEIYEAAHQGKTNFIITEEHIRNAGKNQFMLSTVNPTNATEDDWKLITPLEYTGYSMVWNMGSGKYLFNVKDTIYQLMDYSYLNYFDYTSYSTVINELGSWGKAMRSEAEKYNSPDYYYYAMYYEAQAVILAVISQKGGYIKPEQAVTHYKIEFRHH